jgi:hypothetical protein
MSLDSGLEFSLQPRLMSHDAPPSLVLLQQLVRDGWRPNDNGRIVFLPRGDNEEFDWQARGLGEESFVWAELEWKASHQEALGLVLTWREDNVGGEFVIRPALSLSVSLAINRRTTAKGITDVSWYLDRLVPTLEKLGQIVEARWAEAG